MPIIQGAVAAGSGTARAAGLTQLTEAERAACIRALQNVREAHWSEHAAAANVEVGPNGVTVAGVVDPNDILVVAPDGSPHSPRQEEELELPKQSCLCGLIEDEYKTREEIMYFFEEPTSSSGAYVVSIVVFLCIIISTITIILESLPDMQSSEDKDNFYIVEIICIAVFTLEYAIRIIAVVDKCGFVIEPMNVIDLVAILPFYLDLIMAAFGMDADDLSLLRLLRLFRIFRIFKLSKYSSGIKICASAIIESKDTLGLMIFMCSISVCIFANFEYYFESGEWNVAQQRYLYSDGKPSPFFSVPASMWWTVVSVMTVGYGDMTPVTWEGQIVAALTMVCSIVILALPISVIGANFSRKWMESKEAEASGSDGRALAYNFQSLLANLIKQNSLVEEILANSAEDLVSLHKDLRHAQLEYNRLASTGRGDNNVLEWPDAVKLRERVEGIQRKDRQLQFAVRKLLAVQDSELEDRARETLLKGKTLEDYILRYQEISANIIGLEQVVFGRSLSVSGHH